MDQEIVSILYNIAASHPFLTHLDVLIAERGIFLLPLALIVLWVWPGRGFTPRRKAVFACAASFVFTIMLIAALGHSTYHPRPFVALDLTPLFPHADVTSFPSDHTLLGMALVAPILLYQRRLGIWLVLWTLLIGFARVAAGVHYPSDILGSALLAIVPATIGLLVSQYLIGQVHFLRVAVHGSRRW